MHNRVQGIERMADFIGNLVPEARVGIAHGQLNEEGIEDVMTKFLSGRLNVLVTTTIIESGIDIPTANTIIINRADRFGLADLYQIKGRVGRSREKAYAYLLAPAEETLTILPASGFGPSRSFPNWAPASASRPRTWKRGAPAICWANSSPAISRPSASTCILR